MRRTVGGALALLVLLPAARALDEAKPAGAPAEQYKALTAEYQKGMDDYLKAYREAKTNEERVKALQQRPNPEKFAERFLALGSGYQVRASLAKRAKENPNLARQIELLMDKEGADEIAK